MSSRHNGFGHRRLGTECPPPSPCVLGSPRDSAQNSVSATLVLSRETPVSRSPSMKRPRHLHQTSISGAVVGSGASVPVHGVRRARLWEEIASSAGVGIGTLYRHFPTRDAPVEAVYRHEVDLLCTRGDELLATLPPDEALAHWMQLFVAHIRTKRGMISVLKPMMAENPAFSSATKGRAVECASKLLAAGVDAEPSATMSTVRTSCEPSAVFACPRIRISPAPASD